MEWLRRFLGTRTDEERLATKLASMLGSGAWCVDSLEERDGWVEMIGWAIAPGHAYEALGFTINDHLFEEINYPLAREDLRRVLWYIPDGQACGFVCRVRGSLASICGDDGTATLKFVSKATLVPVREEHNYYFNVRDAVGELPPPHLRTRVHGAPSDIAFRLEGYTNFVKLQHALQRIFSRSYRDAGRILDWGVGCGRFSRYFSAFEPKLEVTGADIDREAVDWVSAHLPVDGVVLPLHPPSPLPSARFDLLIGISIFTHLGEQDQFDWLEELGRVAAPGAVLLMSTHGDTAVSRQAWSLEKLERWRQTGFDAGVSRDLADILDETDADYYKTTCHTTRYIRKNWAKYFDIVEIIPGYVGNLQDLVVMVRR